MTCFFGFILLNFLFVAQERTERPQIKAGNVSEIIKAQNLRNLYPNCNHGIIKAMTNLSMFKAISLSFMDGNN